jgi:hypothetical protein
MQADLSALRSSAQRKEGKDRRVYWLVEFDVVLTFSTKLEAKLRWTENVGQLTLVKWKVCLMKNGPKRFLLSRGLQKKERRP